MATKKCKCNKCGYIYEGETPPNKCPECGAPASDFELVKKGGLNTDSNVYTMVYAAAMVVVVALLLAFTSQSLGSLQKNNEANDKRQQILRSVNVDVSANAAEAKYKELIKDAYLVDENGQKVDGDAFSEDVEKAFAKGMFPVFVASVDGKTKYIMAMRGTGLWGPIWGYLSVDEDCNTVFGADFSHAGETPGLGAEISNKTFSGQFAGKQLFKDGAFKSVAVVKKGKAAKEQDYVDGISGGTITSNGVNAMLQTSIGHYAKFLTTQK